MVSGISLSDRGYSIDLRNNWYKNSLLSLNNSQDILYLNKEMIKFFFIFYF